MKCRVLLGIAVLGLLVGCSQETTFPSSAFSLPIDFTYACLGESGTVAPDNDERAAIWEETRMCPDVSVTADGVTFQRQGILLGLVLDQSPAGVHLIQMNPAAGTQAVLDANRFIPGYSAITVGDSPIRILRDSQWGAFYVLSAGSQSVTRLVIHAVGESVDYETTEFGLPGVPSDGVIVGDQLFVSASRSKALWRYDLNPVNTTPTTIQLDDVIHRMQASDGQLVVTWKARPVVSVFDGNGVLLDEAGLVAACADTLDNDDDGLVDKLDPDCRRGSQLTEDVSSLEVLASTEPIAAYQGVSTCADGVDNDGDGWIDLLDEACSDANGDERVPACADGLDNDGDGEVDMVDGGCYHADGQSEGETAHGPFFSTVVTASNGDRFLYVLNEAAADLAVFELTGTLLTRVDVNAFESLVPDMPYRTYGGTGGLTLGAVRGAAYPALSHQGLKNLVLPSGSNMNSIVHAPSRGELWQRYITPESGSNRAEVAEGLSSETFFIPAGCDPDTLDVCIQPTGDDDTHYVVGPRLDGSIQMIQAVHRGQARHRFAQRSNDPSTRSWSISHPTLAVRGESIPVGNSLLEGHPFLGPTVFEPVQEYLATVQPQLNREYGIWPPDDPEMAPSEVWTLTYEGVLPHTSGHLGRLLDATTFYAPDGQFCTLGAQKGDWLTVSASVQAVDSKLLGPTSLTAGDVTCPLIGAKTVQIDLPITEVGQITLKVDASGARRVPQVPELDTSGLSAADTVTCGDLITEIKATLGTAQGTTPYEAITNFDGGMLPDRVQFVVRAAAQWTVVGDQSGYIHRWAWENGTCVEETTLPVELTGRVTEASVKAGTYASCPPDQETLTIDALEDTIDVANRLQL
jgi:hypothetical protein